MKHLKSIIRFIKRFPLYLLFGRWRRQPTLIPGYTIALPVPMDMPFLLRLALEGLQSMDTTNCKQILIVPDGWGFDRGAALKSVLSEFSDPRIEFVELRDIDYRVIRAMRPPGCARTHWMLVVNSVIQAKHEYVFLHDADAFFLTRDGIERQYREALDKQLDVLGVTARWDEFFRQNHVTVAGTWEMLFSTRWARKRSPMALFPGKWNTEFGEHGFDSTLYAQFLDHASGAIGVMQNPPELVHFNGTIYTYRTFRDRRGQQVTDELFRVLLLSLLETSIDVPSDLRATPTVAELQRGLTDTQAPVLYNSEINRRGYGEFRQMIRSTVDSPTFGGKRGQIILNLLAPFDAHFQYSADQTVQPALSGATTRETGLGG